MAPSQSKRQQKTYREKKGKNECKEVTPPLSQKKKKHTEERKSQEKRQDERRSNDQANSEDMSSEKDDAVSLQDEAKSSRELRRQNEGREGGFKARREKKEPKVKGGHFNRRHGGQYVCKREKAKSRDVRREDQSKDEKGSDPEYFRSVKNHKQKETEDSEEHAVKGKCKSQLNKKKIVSDMESLQVESEEVLSWMPEPCQRRHHEESRGRRKKKSHSKTGRVQSEGQKKARIKNPDCVFSRASPVSSEDSSCSDPQDKCNLNQRRKSQEIQKKIIKVQEEISSSEDSEEQFCSKKGLPTIVENQHTDNRRDHQEFQQTTSESEGKPDNGAKIWGSEDKENDSELVEKISRKNKKHVQRKATPGISYKHSDGESTPGNHSGSSTEGAEGEGEGESDDREHDYRLRGGGDKDDPSCEQRSEEDKEEKSSFEERSSPKIRRRPSNNNLTRHLQETIQEREKKNSKSQVSRTETSSSSQAVKDKKQPSHQAGASQEFTSLEDQTSQDPRTRLDAVAFLAKRYCHLTSQSQILLNLKNRHRDVKAKLLAADTLCYSSKPAEIVSGSEKTQSIHPRRDTTRCNVVAVQAKEGKDSRLSLSTSSSSYSDTKKPLAEKKKKVGKGTGKVKKAKHQTLETKKEVVMEEEQTGEEKELTPKQTRSKSLQTLSAFRKVTHWLSHKPLKKTSLKGRFLSMVRAVGISGWLVKRFHKKKRSSQPSGFRRKMAIRIVSTVGLAKRCSRTSHDSGRKQIKKDLCSKGASCSLLECDHNVGKGAIRRREQDEEKRFSSNYPHKEATQLMNSNGQSEEERRNGIDARFAIVFPRVHQLVKSKASSLRSSGNSASQVHPNIQSRRRPLTSTQLNRQRSNQELPCSFHTDTTLPEEEEISWGSAPSFLEEEDVEDLIQRTAPETLDQVHWTQCQSLTCDPTAWLNSEMLLPRLTIENLSKWSLYKGQYVTRSPRSKRALQGRWEVEDVNEDILEKDLAQRQVDKDEDCYMELEKVEDLSRLEEVCESSVLLCLKKRFHRNFIYTYIGHILICVSSFKPLSLYSEELMMQYQKGMLSRNAPHIFAITEMAYAISQTSEKEQCIVISGQSGSGKTEAAKAIILYLSRLYQRQESPVKKQPTDVLPILESFGNAKTILNDNSSRFGKFLHVHLRRGFMSGTSISHYLLEKSRVIFQGPGERSFHVFYELLAGLPVEQKEKLYLQEPETYFYLNQGGVCEIPGKIDDKDFLVLIKALQTIGLSDDQLTAIWAVLAGILQLGNICFTSCEKEYFELAVIPSEKEIQIIANLLHISADLLQKAITHQVTETCYDQICTPLSVESAIDARDAIAKGLYSVLFEWLMMTINEWLSPLEMDSTVGIVDIYGFEDLGVNSLEQLCINFANEHLQQCFNRIVISQEEEEYTQEDLIWTPVAKISTESCLDLIAGRPHGILRILDDQTLLSQATDHTFLQKCHYHHTSSRWYSKPKLPLPVFTIQHYAGPVTYQVHKFLNKNHDQLHSEILDIFSQSHLKLLSSLFQRVKVQQANWREPGTRIQGLQRQSPTLASRFQQSLQELTAKLDRSHIFFVRCIKSNSKKVPNIFDTEYVACQLRHSGILEAICIRKEGYPIRIPFQHFLIRYGVLLSGRSLSCLQERDGCVAVLSHVVGDLPELYQIGVTKVFLKEKARKILERRWNQKLSWAIVTLQRNLRGLINHRRLQAFKQKATIIQAHFRGFLARKRYQRLKKTLTQFGVSMIVSRPVVNRRRQYQKCEESWQKTESLAKGAEQNRRCLKMDVRRLEIPADLAAQLHLAEGHHHAQTNKVTEVSPPEVKAKFDLSLPPDINSFPFSIFMRSHFQEMGLPDLGQPLKQPLTRLDGEQRQTALQLNKVILRFIGDKGLEAWQEEVLGNYIASRGLASPSLRNELLCQVVSQVWRNMDLEQCQRGWTLMATLLGTFAPSPALEKPLLKFVSDYGLESYNGICQRKLLMSMQQMEKDPEMSRSFPPTQLEWTTNQRKGKMVLDVYTYKEEMLSAEVDSWTTGEQYAGWALSSRGLDTVPRGWTVSMFAGQGWQDLAGCDFVLDLIGELEAGNGPSESTPAYPITPEQDESYLRQNFPNRTPLNIPPAPDIRAPSFPPPSLPPDFDSIAYSEPGSRNSPRGVDHYVDGLFRPLLDHAARNYSSDLDSEGSLTGRMKGGGKIGPGQQGIFPGYSGMMTMPAYQPMPVMGGIMPGLGGMGTMPAMMMPQAQPVMPSLDPNQVAAQQQAFINQQALLLAQQMTLQAMTLSQQQQGPQHRQRERSPEFPRARRSPSRRRSPEPSRPWRGSPPRSPEFPRRRTSTKRRSPERSRARRASPQDESPESSRQKQDSPPPPQSSVAAKPKRLSSSQKKVSANHQSESLPEAPELIHICQEKEHPGIKTGTLSKETIQKKIEYFQKIGQQPSPMKSITPPSKTWKPPNKLQPEDQQKPQNAGLKENNQAQPSLPEPSQEIKNIVKTHQNRPVPPPVPAKPLRNISKPFVKKHNPKEEALAKLGIAGLGPSPQSPTSPERSMPSPPPPGKLSHSIREKQLPLMNLFARPSPASPTAASVLPPPVASPPLPPPPLPTDYTPEETGVQGSARTMKEDTNIKTQLINLSASVSFSYANSSWKIFLRKEVFYPKENFSHPYCLNLLCDQIITDTYSESCIRISREERRKMKDLLADFKVGMDASSILEDGIKKRIVVAARDNWTNYFSRLFPVKGDSGSDVQILGVSHRGLQLLKRAKEVSFSPEYLKLLCSYSYADVLSLELMGQNILQFSLRNEQLILHSPKARQIKAMVELFLHELKQDSKYVIALRSYVTDDKSLLNFKKGDFIRIVPMEGLEPGWQFGSVGGRSGLFPSSMVQLSAAPDYLGLHMNREEEGRKSLRRGTQEKIISKQNSTPPVVSKVGSTSTAPETCHYTMMEFAATHFRGAQPKLGWEEMSAELEDPALLVQHTKVPIQESLLFYSNGKMNDLATKTFMTLMRFMEDAPGIKKKNEIDYINEILQLCKEKENLRDEIYCQVIKQVTQNPEQDRSRRGWQLLSLLTGYFLPSSTLLPYVTKYFQQASSESSSPFIETARICQSNLRKMVLNGGRRRLPFRGEMEAFLKGRSSRRIVIKLAGGQGYPTKLKTFTVAAEVMKEISEYLGIADQEEIQEFAIFASQGHGKVVRPLRQKEYLHDYLLENSSIELSFSRITWKIPLHFENENYINLHYNQVLQSYMTGKLQCNSELEQQVVTLALLQHWAKGARSLPSTEELRSCIPDPVVQLINLETIHNFVTHDLEQRQPLEQLEAKIQFIEHMVQIPLFGYNVYFVERISIPGLLKPCFIGVNQEQIIIVDGKLQNLHCRIPLKEIQRMRTMPPLGESGTPGLEVNYGSPNNPKTIWFELKQAKLLYHTIAIIAEEATDSEA